MHLPQMSSTNFFDKLPVFDGTNWMEWSTKMTDYLMKMELWVYPSGTAIKPEEPASSASAAEKREAKKDILAWERADESVVGNINFKLRRDIRTLYQSHKVSKDLWDALEKAYGKEPYAITYGRFKQLLRLKFGSQNPQKEFSRWDVLIQQLAEGGIEMDAKLLAVLFEEAIPRDMEKVLSPLITQMVHDEKHSA